MIQTSNNHLLLSPLLFVTLLAFYFNPLTQNLAQQLDAQIFFLLNGSLKNCSLWQSFFMAMNHKYEKIVVPFVFLATNLTIVFIAKKKERMKFISYTLITLLFLELAVAINFILFSRVIIIDRQSPSLLLTPFISLTEIFSNQLVKTVSYSSFPGDHAFVTSCWAMLTWSYAPNKIRALILLIALIIIPARVVGGAHWFSDIMFSISFAYLITSYLTYTKAWAFCTNFVIKILSRYGPFAKKRN